MKTVFTTGQVAKLCRVAPRTVSKWFDSGRLRGYRIPGSQDRRIPRENLIRFLKEHGMPLGELEDPTDLTLLVSEDPRILDEIQKYNQDCNLNLAHVKCAFEAGTQCESLKPDCLIVHHSIGEAAATLVQGIRRSREHDAMILVGLLPREAVGVRIFDRTQFNEVFECPWDYSEVLNRIKSMIHTKEDLLQST